MLESIADREAGRRPPHGLDAASSASQKADRILARAEERARGSRTAKAFDNGDSKLNKLDMTAAVIGAIMTIGPLFAAFVGRLMPPS